MDLETMVHMQVYYQLFRAVYTCSESNKLQISASLFSIPAILDIDFREKN